MRSTERYSRSNSAPDVASWAVSAIARAGLVETPRSTMPYFRKNKTNVGPPLAHTKEIIKETIKRWEENGDS